MNDDIRTIAEYRAAAEATGEWVETQVDFSIDGKTWAPFILPTDEQPHPVLARATIIRKSGDAERMTTTVLLWDESIPEDEFAAVWERRPHLLFGSAAERAGLRRTFPSALAGIAATDREQWTTVPPAGAPQTTESIDWTAEIDRTESVVGIDALHKTMRARRVFTPDETGIHLERMLKERRKLLVQREQGPDEDERAEAEAREAAES